MAPCTRSSSKLKLISDTNKTTQPCTRSSKPELISDTNRAVRPCTRSFKPKLISDTNRAVRPCTRSSSKPKPISSTNKTMRPCIRSSKLKLSDKTSKFKEDMISELPDEVIVYILSVLKINVATRTSVLSRRWEKLWTFYNGSLIFDFDFDFMKHQFRRKVDDLGERKRTYFINWVDQALFSLTGSNAIDLTIRFQFDEASRCHIDKWVEFALDRRIRRLELDMGSMPPNGSILIPYTFPIQFWTRVKQPRGSLHCISALTSLILKNVDISGEQVEYFLSNCPLLERLCVRSSKQVSNLKVTGTKLQLKHLEVLLCYKLESLEISAPNLLSFSFTYFGQPVKLRVENVPQLVQMSFGIQACSDFVGSLSSHFSQLETLHLGLSSEADKMITQNLDLIKLKHLNLTIWSDYDEIVFGWTSLIKSSPLLHKLTFKVMKSGRKDWIATQKELEYEYPHKCLKVVEIVGFTGCPTDAELLMSFADSNALDQIIIDCRKLQLIGSNYYLVSPEKGAEECAVCLKTKLPSGIDVIVV